MAFPFSGVDTDNDDETWLIISIQSRRRRRNRDEVPSLGNQEIDTRDRDWDLGPDQRMGSDRQGDRTSDASTMRTDQYNKVSFPSLYFSLDTLYILSNIPYIRSTLHNHTTRTQVRNDNGQTTSQLPINVFERIRVEAQYRVG